MSGFLDRLVRRPGANPAGPVPAGDGIAGETETVRRIAARLRSLTPDRARFLAGFAYVLTRAANADLETSDAEAAVMVSALVEVGDLDEAQAVLVVEMARLQSRAMFENPEDFLVTREFGRLATDEEKIAVLRACFAVGAADDEISDDEAGAVNEIARELGVDRPTLNGISAAYVDQFALIRAARRLARGT